jgi:hypothetical protein
MKFNMSKFLKKTAMPVPLPSPETLKKIKEEGYGLARDVETAKSPEIGGVNPEISEGMGLGSGESMRTIPLKDSFEYQGRTVYPIKIDKDVLIVIDPETIPGEPVGGVPNNYIRIPIDDPSVVEFFGKNEQGFQPHYRKMEELIVGWNKFLEDLNRPDKFNGANIVQLPLMIFKEKEQNITPRINELQGMERSLSEKAAETTSPALLQAEIEWREKINSHELNYQDTVDTIKKLYKGREAQLLEDVNSGALDPSDEWKDHWLEEFPVEGEDGQVKTTTPLQAWVSKVIEEKEEKRNKPSTMKDEVSMPGEILEELPKKSPFTSIPTFTGPSANIGSSAIAALIGVRDEIRDLQELDGQLTKAADEISALQSKSDNYLIQHPEEYSSILNTIESDASAFVRRYSKSIQNQSKRTAKPPAGMESWSDRKRQQLKTDNGFTLPGAINASFLGKNIASAAVSIYLFKIIAMIRKVEERMQQKREQVQASSNSLKKVAQSEFQTDEAAEKALRDRKMSALKRLNWIEESLDKVNSAFIFISNDVGAGPDAVESMSLQMKVDMIEKAINQMNYDRLGKFINLVSTL